MLNVKNLCASVEDVENSEILKGVNLEVNPGEIHAIMGPNGSGKSTFSNVLMGRPDYEVTDGEIIFNGEDIVDLPVGLNFINTLIPRQFKWQTRDGNIKDGLYRAGFIAQELQEAQKDSDYLDLVLDKNPERLEAKQEHLIPVLVKAIQELSAKNTTLETRVAALEAA